MDPDLLIRIFTTRLAELLPWVLSGLALVAGEVRDPDRLPTPV